MSQQKELGKGATIIRYYLDLVFALIIKLSQVVLS